MIRQILKVRLELLSHIVYELSRIFYLSWHFEIITLLVQFRNAINDYVLNCTRRTSLNRNRGKRSRKMQCFTINHNVSVTSILCVYFCNSVFSQTSVECILTIAILTSGTCCCCRPEAGLSTDSSSSSCLL